MALVSQGSKTQALTAFSAALRADALHPEAANNLGNVLRTLGRDAEALPYLQSAVTAQPGVADVHMNLGLVLHALQRYDEAIAAFARVLELAPQTPYALGALVWSELHACAWDELGAHQDALRAQVRAGVPQSPFTLLAVSDSPAEQRRCGARPAPTRNRRTRTTRSAWRS